jgi:hypothetical protein
MALAETSMQKLNAVFAAQIGGNFNRDKIRKCAGAGKTEAFE